MKKTTLKIVLFFTLYCIVHFMGSAQDDVGMNLGDPRSGLVFVDIVKDTRGFQKPDKVDGKFVASATDSGGWPTEDFVLTCFDLRNGRGYGSENSPAQDPNPPRLNVDGIYKASFKGTAERVRVKFDGEILNESYNAATNTTTFDIDFRTNLPGRPFFQIELIGTKRNPSSAQNTGITDLKIVRPGYELDTDQVFTDLWLNAIAPFSIYRYMDWSQTNGNATFSNPDQELGPLEISWNQRRVARENDATTIRAGSFDNRGLAWETIIDHINITGKDAWINVPIHANDNYVRNLARLFKNRLTADITLYVEYSNEAWNFAGAFSQTDWNFQKAVQEANSGSIIAQGANGNDNLWAARRMAKRTVEIGQIFQNEGVGTIGGNLRPVLQYFASAPGSAAAGSPFLATVAMVAFIEDNYGPVNQYISSISRTGYFGAATIDALPEGSSVAEILEAAEAGIPSDYQDFGDFALEKGLEFSVYEGAPGHRVNATKNLLNRVRAERTAEMGELIKKNFYDGFKANNGGTFMYFASHKFYTQSGFWGTTDIITDLNRGFKYKALIDIIDGTPFDRKPIIATSSLPVGLIGEEYNAAIRVSGGDLPITLQRVAGRLPNGLSISAGAISGTPTQTGSFTFTIQVQDATGDRVSKAFTLQIGEVIDIARVPTAPVIDGEIDDLWNSRPEYALNNVLVGGSTSSSDFAVRFKSAWDTTALYYLIEVTDESLINDSEQVFQDDGAELYLDIGNDKLAVYGPDDYQIQFGYDDDEVVIGKGLPIANIQKSQVRTANGYRIEFSIPWNSLNATVAEGTLLGFDVHAQDDDDGGDRDTKVSFNAITDVSFRDPSSFGIARLTGDGDVPPNESEYFYIQQKVSGEYLRPASRFVGAKMRVLPKTDSDFFLWRKVAVPGSSEYFFLENKGTGHRFRPVADNRGEGTAIRYSVNAAMEAKQSFLEGTAVQWALVDIPNDTYGYLVNRQATGFHVRARTNTNRDLVLKPDTWRGDHTRWLFEPANARPDTINAVANVEDVSEQANGTEEPEISYFPNPVRSTLYLTGNAVGKVYGIYDLNGKLMVTGTFAEGNVTRIDLSKLSQGIYIVQTGKKRFKVIKE